MYVFPATYTVQLHSVAIIGSSVRLKRPPRPKVLLGHLCRRSVWQLGDCQKQARDVEICRFEYLQKTSQTPPYRLMPGFTFLMGEPVGRNHPKTMRRVVRRTYWAKPSSNKYIFFFKSSQRVIQFGNQCSLCIPMLADPCMFFQPHTQYSCTP